MILKRFPSVLNYYLKQVFAMTPVQITAYLTILNFPWFIKPLYGIVSDFLPVFGYRRKSYLMLANGAAATLVDDHGLVTSRSPDDLSEFSRQAIVEFAKP